ATRQTTRTMVAPPRRGISLEGPHGLVRGIARVLDGGRRDGPELAPAPPDRAKRQPAAAAGFSSATDNDTRPPAGEHELDAEAPFVDAEPASVAAEPASVAAEAAAPAEETGPGAVDMPE